MKVPRKGAMNIEKERYGDSINGFAWIVGVPSLLYKMLIYISLNSYNSNSYTVEDEWQDDSNGTLTILVALLGQKL